MLNPMKSLNDKLREKNVVSFKEEEEEVKEELIAPAPPVEAADEVKVKVKKHK